MAVHLSLITSSDETTIAKYTRLRSHRTSLILREAPVFTSAASKNSGGTPQADSPPFSVAPPQPSKLQGDKNRQHPVAHFALAENPLRLNRLFVMLAYGQSSKPTGSLRLPFGFPGFTSGLPCSTSFSACVELRQHSCRMPLRRRGHTGVLQNHRSFYYILEPMI